MVKGDLIESIDYKDSLEIPAGAVVYDLEGKYIIPGLIDGHVHISHGTHAEAERHLEATLRKGVTAVRDMGGDGRMLGSLHRNMLIGETKGSDVYYGTIIAGPTFFVDDPRPQSVAQGRIAGKVPWQKSLSDDDDVRQIVAELKGNGSSAIKCYANLDKKQLTRIAAEAKRQGLQTWGHANLPPTKPSEVVDAGIQVISHADMIQGELAKELHDRHSFESREAAMAYRRELQSIKWDENAPEIKSLFKEMKKNEVIIDATLFVYYYPLTGVGARASKDSTRFKTGLAVTGSAYRYGIKILAGTDHMVENSGHGINVNLHKELELLKEAGLSNIDILRAATLHNAEALGLEDKMGTLEEGKLANIVVLNANPLETIKNTQKIKHVIKRGKVIL